MRRPEDPFENYVPDLTYLRVGMLNRIMDDETVPGFQRDRGRRGRPPARLVGRIRALQRKPWDVRVFTPRLISLRSDGTYFVLDGNASNHWVEEMFGPDTPVPCIVLEDLSPEEEAELFDKAQNSKVVSKALQFEAARIAGELRATTITEILAEYGYVVGNGRKAGNFGQSAVGYVYDRGGVTRLRRVLSFIKDNFDEDPQSTNFGFVKALGDLMGNEELAIDDRILGKALRGVSIGADLLQGTSGGTAYTFCLRNMKERYHEYTS